MTQRHFVTPDYTVFAGWNAESQSLYLNIYHHFWEDSADRNRYDTPLTSEAPTVADVAEALARYHITPPAYFLEDLAEDQAHNEHTDWHVTYQMPVDLDDTDPLYDPETGTASIQTEYGERPDLGDAEAASPLERGRIEQLADRIREWFHRDQDRGMSL
jgi:hypothetical protein